MKVAPLEQNQMIEDEEERPQDAEPPQEALIEAPNQIERPLENHQNRNLDDDNF